MNVSVAMGGSGTRRFFGLAADALRGIRWPQVRGAILFGLGAFVFTGMISPGPVIQFAKVMPMHLLFPGWAIEFQIKAFVLLGAIVIADRAVDEGARRRLCDNRSLSWTRSPLS